MRTSQNLLHANYRQVLIDKVIINILIAATFLGVLGLSALNVYSDLLESNIIALQSERDLVESIQNEISTVKGDIDRYKSMLSSEKDRYIQLTEGTTATQEYEANYYASQEFMRYLFDNKPRNLTILSLESNIDSSYANNEYPGEPMPGDYEDPSAMQSSNPNILQYSRDLANCIVTIKGFADSAESVANYVLAIDSDTDYISSYSMKGIQEVVLDSENAYLFEIKLTLKEARRTWEDIK